MSYNFKPHTIRKDKHNRWKPGMDIHFFEWTGKPYRSPQFKFSPVVKCISVQDIEIRWTDPDGLRLYDPVIYIDGTWITRKQTEKLSKNDGFDSLYSFYAWFNQDFTGRIIHWTSLKY